MPGRRLERELLAQRGKQLRWGWKPVAPRSHILSDCLCDCLCEIAGFSALEMPRQDEIGFRRRFRGFLEEQIHQFFFRHCGGGHGSPLRSDRATEGVAQRGPGVLRAGEGCSCQFRVRWNQQISNLLDAHLRRRIGNANAVVIELTQQNFCFETGHCDSSPCLQIQVEPMLWLEKAGLHRQPRDCNFLCGCWWFLSYQILIRRVVGNRSILRLKPRERPHLRRAHCLGGSQLIASEIVALTNLLLDGALNIAKRVLWIAPARPGERVTQESQPVGIRREPRFIDSRSIVMSYMREAHREAVVEALGKRCPRPFGFNEVQESVAKIAFVLCR